jgi:uncharacterized protein (DUF1778 family)
MPTRTDRIETRVAPETAEKIRQAAALSGMSTSAFMVDAAADRAERLLRSQRETVVPSEFFDKLLESLDEPDEPVPALQKAFARLHEIAEPYPERSPSQRPAKRRA